MKKEVISTDLLRELAEIARGKEEQNSVVKGWASCGLRRDRIKKAERCIVHFSA